MNLTTSIFTTSDQMATIFQPDMEKVEAVYLSDFKQSSDQTKSASEVLAREFRIYGSQLEVCICGEQWGPGAVYISRDHKDGAKALYSTFIQEPIVAMLTKTAMIDSLLAKSDPDYTAAEVTSITESLSEADQTQTA